MTQGQKGLTAILAAYTIWGLFPVYWKELGSISPTELLYLRLILTAIACFLLLQLNRRWPEFRRVWRHPAAIGRSFAAALLLSGNWFSFIWAVNSDRVLESSLGYFLCPIVSVLLGRWFVDETLSWLKWGAVLLSAVGVLILIEATGYVPMAALTIAATWGGYSLVKKKSSRGPITALGMETMLLSPVALLALTLLARTGSGLTLFEASGHTHGLLLLVGFLTATPLLLFAYAAQRIRLATMGMGQYVVPSFHFFLAMAYGEPMSTGVLIGFGLIWVALAVYSLSK